ncbi:hypothetical protein F5Y15DRAFT_159417 [Xylariaceae sp. FL0016]|nr:hypothetical protein F5Y15DRAFT_159417 [Xylariaceae sp. FL0016]
MATMSQRPLYCVLINCLIILSLVAQRASAEAPLARSRSQFTQVPQDFAVGLFHKSLHDSDKCQGWYENYTSPTVEDTWAEGHVQASNLANCILQQLPEWAKSELATISITLGLLPAALQYVGPDTTQIALLSFRRPLLATLLSFGSPALRPGEDVVEVLRTPAKLSLGAMPGFAAFGRGKSSGWTRWVIAVALSMLEYAVAGASVFNMGYQVYFLIYKAVCWAAIQLFHTSYVPETAVPLMWILFGIPAQWIFNGAVRLRVEEITSDIQSSMESTVEATFSRPRPGPILRISSWFRDLVCSELTPCMYGTPLNFRTKKHSLSSMLFDQFTNLASLAHILMGTIILSTMVFVGLRRVIFLEVWFLTGALGCRAVATFEVYGLKQGATDHGDESQYSSVMNADMSAEPSK